MHEFIHDTFTDICYVKVQLASRKGNLERTRCPLAKCDTSALFFTDTNQGTV